jgi:hypothetical protein
VDRNYTVVSKIRKQYLPGGPIYRGTHQAMRDMGQAYLAEHR